MDVVHGVLMAQRKQKGPSLQAQIKAATSRKLPPSSKAKREQKARDFKINEMGPDNEHPVRVPVSPGWKSRRRRRRDRMI
jgi:hypothetical protein